MCCIFFYVTGYCDVEKDNVNKREVFIWIEKGHFAREVVLESFMPTTVNALVSIQWNCSNKNGV